MKKILVVVFILVVSFAFQIDNATAANLPLLDYTGDFDYMYSHTDSVCTKYKRNGSCQTWSNTEVNDWQLTLSSFNITGGNYADGSYFGDGTDAITNAYFQIGPLYNDDSPNNLSFDDTAGAGGGDVSFSITDGANTFLSGTLGAFVVDDGFFGTNLYFGALTNVTYGAAPYSQYISELQLTDEPFNLDMNLSFNSGPSGSGSAFTADASGTVGGKLGAGTLSVVPEPVSSILFVIGGLTLGFRRYRLKKQL